MMDVRASDRMYNCLPTYHSVGGVLATGAVLLGGGSVVICERFSASQCWDDVIRWDCVKDSPYYGAALAAVAAGTAPENYRSTW